MPCNWAAITVVLDNHLDGDEEDEEAMTRPATKVGNHVLVTKA